MDALAIFNSLEAAFWMTTGFVVFQKSRSNRLHRQLGFVAASWFALFGISDIFEVMTGAWWRPWPLLLLKASCVLALVACGIVYAKSPRRR